MGFYLEYDKTKRYISDSYLRHEMLQNNETPNSVIIRLNNDDELILKKLSAESDDVTVDDLIDNFLKNVTELDVDKKCAILNMNRPYVLAILYLLYDGRLSSAELDDIIGAPSYTTRAEILLSKLTNPDNDVTIDILAPLYGAVLKKSNCVNHGEFAYYKNMTPVDLVEALSAEKIETNFLYVNPGQYIFSDSSYGSDTFTSFCNRMTYNKIYKTKWYKESEFKTLKEVMEGNKSLKEIFEEVFCIGVDIILVRWGLESKEVRDQFREYVKKIESTNNNIDTEILAVAKYTEILNLSKKICMKAWEISPSAQAWFNHVGKCWSDVFSETGILVNRTLIEEDTITNILADLVKASYDHRLDTTRDSFEREIEDYTDFNIESYIKSAYRVHFNHGLHSAVLSKNDGSDVGIGEEKFIPFDIDGFRKYLTLEIDKSDAPVSKRRHKDKVLIKFAGSVIKEIEVSVSKIALKNFKIVQKPSILGITNEEDNLELFSILNAVTNVPELGNNGSYIHLRKTEDGMVQIFNGSAYKPDGTECSIEDISMVNSSNKRLEDPVTSMGYLGYTDIASVDQILDAILSIYTDKIKIETSTTFSGGYENTIYELKFDGTKIKDKSGKVSNALRAISLSNNKNIFSVFDDIITGNNDGSKYTFYDEFGGIDRGIIPVYAYFNTDNTSRNLLSGSDVRIQFSKEFEKHLSSDEISLMDGIINKFSKFTGMRHTRNLEVPKELVTSLCLNNNHFIRNVIGYDIPDTKNSKTLQQHPTFFDIFDYENILKFDMLFEKCDDSDLCRIVNFGTVSILDTIKDIVNSFNITTTVDRNKLQASPLAVVTRIKNEIDKISVSRMDGSLEKTIALKILKAYMNYLVTESASIDDIFILEKGYFFIYNLIFCFRHSLIMFPRALNLFYGSKWYSKLYENPLGCDKGLDLLKEFYNENSKFNKIKDDINKYSLQPSKLESFKIKEYNFSDAISKGGGSNYVI